jgi:hypothetical protein
MVIIISKTSNLPKKGLESNIEDLKKAPIGHFEALTGLH